MASDWMRLEMLPGVMESDSPVMPPYASVGMPHSGPCTRGKSKNSTSITGAPCSISMPAVRAESSGGRAGACTIASPAVSTSAVAKMSVAVGMLWL